MAGLQIFQKLSTYLENKNEIISQLATKCNL